MNKTQTFITAAIAGIISTSGMMIATPAHAADAAKGKCMGGNACKAKSACKTAKNACAGQNACGGKGFTEATDAKDCAAQAKTNKQKHAHFMAAVTEKTHDKTEEKKTETKTTEKTSG